MAAVRRDGGKGNGKTNGKSNGKSNGKLFAPRNAAAEGPEAIAGRKIVGMGWQPDIPDVRDWELGSPQVANVLTKKKLKLRPYGSVPKSVDISQHCSPIEDQGRLGSCTAQSVVGMMEYMMRRAGVSHVDLSRLFLYKVSRKLMGLTGDTGAYLRTTMQAAVVFGVPPEVHHSYVISRYEEEPSAFCYAYAASFHALNYARLDGKGQSGGDTLKSLKQILATGFAAVLGFPVYSSMSSEPDIPYPNPTDSLEGGHAVMVVGYDDEHKLGGNGKKTPSLKIRNSWGVDWGEDGYGYLPYGYVEDELAVDVWSIFKSEWIDVKQFG